MEMDGRGWALSPATENLGRLAADFPQMFGKSNLTTNFDPLIEVAIRRAGGSYFKTALHTDGNLLQTEGNGCHVVHLHGYWYGADTLHTGRQLGQSRPRLKASLAAVLRSKLVVVCAYSGWDDSFTDTLMEVVRDDSAFPEIMWAFHASEPVVNDSLTQRLLPGMDRGRVNLYSGVNCHSFFPELYKAWQGDQGRHTQRQNPDSNPVRVSGELVSAVENRARSGVATVIEGDDEDRPPSVEICVGRDDELAQIQASTAKIVFLTGVGGQGKSTLAARYFEDCQKNQSFSVYVWRDCKEESERFEIQLASVIERLSNGKMSGEDLAKQSAASLVDVLLGFIRNLRVLFVFDNADHYVNLEELRMMAGTALLLDALLHSDVNCRVIFTCRPEIIHEHALVLSLRLGGISLPAAVRLFEKRGAPSASDEIADAHELTEGHAFWLDLLAVQAAKKTGDVELASLVEQIRSGAGPIPENTLNSIWQTLRERERIVLRAMAETVKPETENEIAEYVSGHGINYSKVIKALKTLRSLNLIVIKQRPASADLLELHPMVRQFVRRNFSHEERSSFILAIIKVYGRFLVRYKGQLSERPSLSILQYWTQTAELDVTAGRHEEAFASLGEVTGAFLSSAYPREFTRAARLLLSESDWMTNYPKYQHFELVFRAQIRLLCNLGETAEADELLRKYAATVQERDARYIHYCDLRCFAFWSRGDFAEAVRWGKIGQTLKASGVDTKFDVAHSLALAERDAGRPEAALPTFLAGRRLSELTDPDELDEKRDGPHYGNVGRCLHFMGQIDDALVCYQKSALLIEKDVRMEHYLNQGFIRAWIGELLMARGQFRLAEAFLLAAGLKWQKVSSPRAAGVRKMVKEVRARIPESRWISERESEKICLEWILGRTRDSQYQ